MAEDNTPQENTPKKIESIVLMDVLGNPFNYSDQDAEVDSIDMLPGLFRIMLSDGDIVGFPIENIASYRVKIVDVEEPGQPDLVVDAESGGTDE